MDGNFNDLTVENCRVEFLLLIGIGQTVNL